MVDDVVAIALVEQAFGERHADGIAEPLPQRPGRGLDAGGMAIFGVARRHRAELAKALQLVDIHARPRR